MADNKTILLVEDDAFVSDIYQTKLEQEGFKLILAEKKDQFLYPGRDRESY